VSSVTGQLLLGSFTLVTKEKNQHKSAQIYIGFLNFLGGNFSTQLFRCELLCSKKYLKFLVSISGCKDSGNFGEIKEKFIPN
jgi:hypothetical protein